MGGPRGHEARAHHRRDRDASLHLARYRADPHLRDPAQAARTDSGSGARTARALRKLNAECAPRRIAPRRAGPETERVLLTRSQTIRSWGAPLPRIVRPTARQ